MYIVLGRIIIYSVAIGFALVQKVAAVEWRIRPNLSMSEIFSDNLELSETAKKSGFISEIAPGLSLYGISPWTNLNLNYRLQGLYNAGGSDAIDINHQLQMNSLYQAVRNTLFLQASSSINQQNISNSFIATDNITGNRDRTTVTNFNISPYWTPHFGQYANGLVKFGYQTTGFDNATDSINTNRISDSENFSKQARLSSGSKFGKIRWNLNYSSEDQNRDTADDVRFEQYQGDLRYFINRKFSIFGQVGYENNDYQTLHDSINNGFFYTFGGRWSPSRWYSLEAGYGNNKHVTVQFNPSSNLIGNITYRNKEVGLNTGDSWDANINYRMPQANIRFLYSQETTTVQQILTQQLDFNVFDPNTGNILIDPNTGLPFEVSINYPILVDDVIINKKANLTFGYQTGKSFYNLSLYNTRRTYELSPQEDNVYGVTASWRWQIETRLNFYVRPTWQYSDISNTRINTNSSNTRYDVALGLTRAVPINLGRPLIMNTGLEFRHITQSSDLSSNDYSENRATANFAVRF